MNLNVALKDKKLKDYIFYNIVLLVIYELVMYVFFFEWNNSINFKMKYLCTAGVVAIPAIILMALGIGNKSKRNLFWGTELLFVALFSIYAYFSLTVFPAVRIYRNLSLFTIIPFILIFIYYISKIIYILKRKMRQ